MLTCCNGFFKPKFYYVLSNFQPYYRKIEYGECPVCGTHKFKDYIQLNDGTDGKHKVLSGKSAFQTYCKWLEKLNHQKHYSLSNQNVYYGDFQKTNKKDSNGNVIYKQLRKNLNGQVEFLNFVHTKVYYGH